MATNLVQNPNLATGGPTVPTGFYVSGWGDRVQTTAIESDVPSWSTPGTRSFRITIASRVSGDSKLMQLEQPGVAPAVVAGQTYNVAIDYKSTVTGGLTAFKHTAAGWSYWRDFGTVPPSAAWTTARAVTPPIPDGVDQIEFGISISSNGTLQTTNYSLTSTAPEFVTAGTAAAQAVASAVTAAVRHSVADAQAQATASADTVAFRDVDLAVGPATGYVLSVGSPTGHPLTAQEGT